jgi:CheY-like chemotaxis protein
MAGRGAAGTVLVADDHDGVRELARFALEADGFSVLEARDGEEALMLAREHAVDVAVLDLGMPRRDGAAVCRALKDDPTAGRVRVLILSGALDAASRRRVDAAAPDAFLSKPFLPSQLLAAVRSLMAR